VPVPGQWGTLPLSMKGALNGTTSKNIYHDFKAGAVDRLYEPGATQGSVAKELGITGTQLKSWRLEIEAVLDWSKIEPILSSIYASQTGRPSYPLLTLFCGLLLGMWYRLSDV
jgi:hypothetical protein